MRIRFGLLQKITKSKISEKRKYNNLRQSLMEYNNKGNGLKTFRIKWKLANKAWRN